MIAHLQYHAESSPLAAAFVPGNRVSDWMDELDTWDVVTERIECFLIPLSMESTEPAGLFVCLHGQTPTLRKAEGFARVAPGVYIPQYARLVPAMNSDELAAIATWHCQVFHPLYGFTGFEEQDRILLSDLLKWPAIDESDWSFAHPGIEAPPALHSIQVLEPDAETVMKSIQESIGSKKLDDIPLPGKTSLLGKIVEWIGRQFFYFLFGLTHLLMRLLPETPPSSYSPRGSTGWLERLGNWASKNLEALQRRRNQEMERLVKMLEQGQRDALEYAIPLNAQFAHRGTSKPGWRLTRNRINGPLQGGGMAADAWDIGDYYSILYRKYIDAANAAIEKKDYKRAAYIHAHLLGDHLAAARLLAQGGFYREAATIYREHLKNLPEAAECLMKGGLYHEAIQIYHVLGLHEKTALCYELAGNQQKAHYYYERVIQNKIAQREYLDAGNLYKTKIENHTRAREVWLRGWSDGSFDACLDAAFQSVQQEEPDQIHHYVQEVFDHHTHPHQRNRFVSVLQKAYAATKGEEPRIKMQAMAYEIIHQEVASGNKHVLYQLSGFLPGDQFVKVDSTRFINQSGFRPRVQKGTSIRINLEPDIDWHDVIFVNKQLLAIGTKDGFAQLARVNRYGHKEHYAWSEQHTSADRWHFIPCPFSSGTVLIKTPRGALLSSRSLIRNKHFESALKIDAPGSLSASQRQFTINENDQLVSISQAPPMLEIADLEGNIERTIPLKDLTGPKNAEAGFGRFQIAARQGYYYTCSDTSFIQLTPEGESHSVALEADPTAISFSLPAPERSYAIVCTAEVCILFAIGKEEPPKLILRFISPMTVVDLSFIGPKQFVLISESEATLFEIDGEKVKVRQQYNGSRAYLKAAPSDERGYFFLMEKSGTIHHLPLEDQ